jgi:hypothetical protein
MTAVSMVALPDISSARLPATYEAARTALAECSNLDECQAWADKAEALASYAKQARDESLRKMADRIQARAIRRCGELLKQIDGRGGDRTKSEGAHTYAQTQRNAAREAGLSPHQQVQAVRVANVPDATFEAQVESDTPPTVTALAELGKRRLVELGDATPDDFKLATAALGALRRFAEFADATDPERASKGLDATEIQRARQLVARVDSWLDRFVTSI